MNMSSKPIVNNPIYIKNKEEMKDVFGTVDFKKYPNLVRKIKIYNLIKKTNKTILLRDCNLNIKELQDIYFINKYNDNEIKKWIKPILNDK